MRRLLAAIVLVAALAACAEEYAPGGPLIETNPCPQPGDPDFEGPGTYENTETGERIECVGPER